MNMAIVGERSVHLRQLFGKVWRQSSTALSPCKIKSRNHHCRADGDANHHDVVIVGGGMVGTALAVALAKHRCFEMKRIVLLEGGKKLNYEKSEQYSNRVVALNKQTRVLLSSIGAWKHIENGRFTPVRKMQVWDATSDAMITFNEDYLADEIAYIVENNLVLHSLDQELENKLNLEVVYNAKVEDITLPKRRGENSKIKLQNGKEISANLLVSIDE